MTVSESYWSRIFNAHTSHYRNHDIECDWDNHNFGFCNDCGEHFWFCATEDYCVEEGMCWAHCTDVVQHHPDVRYYASMFNVNRGYTKEEAEEMHADRELMRDEFHR